MNHWRASAASLATGAPLRRPELAATISDLTGLVLSHLPIGISGLTGLLLRRLAMRLSGLIGLVFRRLATSTFGLVAQRLLTNPSDAPNYERWRVVAWRQELPCRKV